LWFTEFNVNQIGRLTTAGLFIEYPVPAGGNPAGIAAGSDGVLWFTGQNSSMIGRITTSGSISQFALPSGSSPWGMTAGPDGALWFAESESHKIGRIATSGAITEYPTSAAPYWITAGPDGALWFTEQLANAFGRVTTTGVVTEYPAHSSPYGIAGGSDGALWSVANRGVIERAPACGLGFSASFASGTLTMNFDLGIDTSANLNIVLQKSDGTPIGEPFSKAISPQVPPQAFTMTWNSVPNLGIITVKPILSAGPGDPLCSEWTTVDTAQ
jgi:streptogramin lyase